MGRLKLFVFLLVLYSSVARSHANLVAQEYWSSALPNTPIPKAVRDHLRPRQNQIPDGAGLVVAVDDAAKANPGILLLDANKQSTINSTDERFIASALIAYYPDKDAPAREENGDPGTAGAANMKQIPAASHPDGDHPDRIDRPSAPAFFLEKDLRRGAKLGFWANRAFWGDYFLPRGVVESIPFSSDRLSEIMRGLSVQPDSTLGERMKETLRMCEKPVPDVETKRCATSLESMVDFAASVLGARDDVGVVTTEVGRRVTGQLYTVAAWSALTAGGETTVACHALPYPYTVFYCHTAPGTRPYRVRMVGAVDGVVVEAAVMCHTDTSAWDPSYKSLLAFNEKPGGASMCHLFQEGDLLWFVSAGSGYAAV